MNGAKRGIAQYWVKYPKAVKYFRKLFEQRYLQGMSILGLVWIVIFCYLPMYGIIIAFKHYNILKPISEVSWAGLEYFLEFFKDESFGRVMKNTLGISSLKLLIGFPLPIIFALFLNEISSLKFKKIIQTVSYLPHFLSWVVLGGILLSWLADTGIANEILVKMGIIKDPVFFIADPKYFWGISVASDIWKELGWKSIIYIAAITGISHELYEAAEMDGAGRFRKMWHVTLPGISITIAILFILSSSSLMSANFDQIFVLRNPLNYEASDVINIYVYRMGLQAARFSLATAVGLFQSLVALVLLLLTNVASKKLAGSSLF